MSQLKNQKVQPHGRRLSIDDEIFALTLYKQSGKAYRFLSRMLSLPSRSTLTALLNHIPFGCGINDHIFDHLKTRVEKLKDIEKCCTLIFDEISLECGLQYSKQLDYIEGLVDYGGEYREIKFADHALVFMIRGLFKKWKQPICFFFCEGTIPTFQLVRIIKEVVRKVRFVGLNIVCICNQGATNQAAINILINETAIKCIKQNKKTNTRDML